MQNFIVIQQLVLGLLHADRRKDRRSKTNEHNFKNLIDNMPKSNSTHAHANVVYSGYDSKIWCKINALEMNQILNSESKLARF
jgi:hypothetical protein